MSGILPAKCRATSSFTNHIGVLPEREERITMEIVVDAWAEKERAKLIFYLEGALPFFL